MQTNRDKTRSVPTTNKDQARSAHLLSGGCSQVFVKVAWRQKLCGFSSARLGRCGRSLGSNVPCRRGLYLTRHTDSNEISFTGIIIIIIKSIMIIIIQYNISKAQYPYVDLAQRTLTLAAHVKLSASFSPPPAL